MRNVTLGQLAPVATMAAPPSREEGESSGGMSVDPKRLVGGLKLRWKWMIIGAATGLALGIAIGILHAKTRWEVSLQIIKRDTPTSFQIGTDGNPYHPREFTASTLESAATSRTVLERVSERSTPKVSAEILKYSTVVEEEKKTDFITLTISGYSSAQATADLANIWAQEVVNFPKDVTTAESREIRDALQAQLVRNQIELKRLDQQTIEAPREEVQLDTYMKSQGDIEMKVDDSKIQIDSLDSEIATLRGELIQQSPLADALQQAKADLEQYRARYTDQNPLVIEKQEKIASLEQEIKADTNADQSDLSKFAGTEVGNHLYMRIVELENEREALVRENEEMGKLREQSLQASDDEYGLTDMLRQKETLETAQTLLLNRLQEMSLFEQNAQEMYLVLAPATVDEVSVKPKGLKVAIYAIAGMIFFGGCAMMLALIAEILNPKMRTPGEAAKAIGSPAMISIPRDCDQTKRNELGAKLWLRWNRERDRDRIARAIWAPVNQEREDDFWNLILAEARRFIPSLLIIDCGSQASPALAALPQLSDGSTQQGVLSLRWNVESFTHAEMRDSCAAVERHRAAGREVWLRFDGVIQEPSTSLARAVGAHPLMVVPLDTQPASFWKEQVELMRDTVGELCGTVVLNGCPVFAS